MARVTVEDCIEKVPNRFELVMTAAQRVRDIVAGAPITVDRDRDKNPVVALREIADTDLNIEDLREGLIKRNQRMFVTADESEEQVDIIGDEADWANMAREALQSGEEDMDFGLDEDEDEGTSTEADPLANLGADEGEDENF